MTKASESGGKFTLLRIELDPGGGVDKHYHHHRHETFSVVDGTLDVTLNGKLHRLSSGTVAECPPETMHSFWNRSQEPVTFDVKIVPGHTEFENMLRVAAGLARDGHMTNKGIPKRFVHMSLLSEWSETQLPGMVQGGIQKVLRWGYRRAVRSGQERALIEQYGGEIV